ncbi:MAG TPA: family 1 glycosylhydrolase [Allosphingosinicella sp.]|nr:family 1 glycosylhydrolase [Allosphingosinicella sp.]
MTRIPLELWAGPECTIVRIGNRWRDQVAETGHRVRASDVALIAGLGIKTVRYPILWESVAPDGPNAYDFAWADERLSMFEDFGIEVIGGLLHHGSGPAYTNLLDPDFALKFADYAARVAERYPRIRQWTPINEPLTTARFSALYGHWYPHRRDYPAFLRALVNQCDGIRRAMTAIRRIDPGARLIQTEDVGKTFSTPHLADQARHENERRWLSLDLLAGRVRPGHALHGFLLDAGIGEAEIEIFAGGEARPDLVGVNHYLTSDRYLDHRTDLYPGLKPGGNGRDIYVDAEAARVDESQCDFGLAARLREVWERYSIPLAITEVHHGCTREQQLRWFAEAWTTAGRLRGEGMDLRAVTLWSMFGAVDWRSLITRDDGAYDVGALDVRAPLPRPTAVAKAAAAYALGETYRHPVLAETGWWRRPERLYSWSGDTSPVPPEGPPLLVTGATGTLGQALARIAAHRGLASRSTDRAALDIQDPGSIAAAIERVRPWAIVNAAGFVRVEDAERETSACMAANATGAANLARACRDNCIPLLTFSSDLVFDGLLGRPYLESDLANPVGMYGQSKLMAERLVSCAGGKALVIRTSAFFGPWDRHNFAWSVLDALRRGEPFSASANDLVSPTFVPDLCHAALDLLIDGETGIWHLANQGATSWFAFARAIACGADLDADLIFARESGPPRNTALASMRGNLLRPLEPALADFLRDVGTVTPAAPRAPALHSAAISVG